MSLSQIGQSIIQKVADKKYKLLSQLENLNSQFNGSCPPKDELIKIINKKNQILIILNQLKTNILRLDQTTNPLEPLIKSLDTSINLLKIAPIPASSLPLGAINVSGDSLSLLKSKTTEFKSNIEAFKQIKQYVLDTIDEITKKVNLLTSNIERCSGDLDTELNNILNTDSNINELQSSGKNEENMYKGFKLEILLDLNNTTRFTKRYVVAKNKLGVILLKGEPSFSSSTQVLLDEIKFQIDSQDLKAN